ncbi:cellulosome enzyme [Actinobacteria bacterium YIM 96077]|uniref:Cellulosome enzyme n=1 Tax=Phytoactinopolyspora halophila TaxID=1981511 RepID=A0A329QUC3_9ACTN|nr:LamG-like jellyroll fold domain-containing protein [Phytoactinopolyspora halophila]AYY13796.1 cellulosome enzyme [Actinobacteria bacterium YIM 96077]RAW15661.1 cellulosome enzyme [Phytoactinopolyspora halophila]
MFPSRSRRFRRTGSAPALLAGTLTAGLLLGGAVTPAATVDLPSPSVHYEFDSDDLTDGTITDTSGHERHGTLVNASTASLVDGASGGQALSLPGGAPDSDGAYVELPRDVLDGATDLTVSARIRWDGERAPWQWIYALGTDTNRYLFSTPHNDSERLRTAITESGAGAESQITGSAAMPAEQWTTLTVTLDTDAGTITTYLDGAAIGSAPTSVTAPDLLDTSTDIAGYIGSSFYPDPLFGGAVDDFRIYPSTLSDGQVADIVDGEIPTPTGVTQDSFELRTAVGDTPDLPDSVPATYSDGYDRPLPVEWDEIDPDEYASTGTFTVSGTAGEWAVTATVTVIREGHISIDLGTDTGDFHGGASGALYGLYGEGVPSSNVIEGMNLRTVATKGQDGAQHPGSDALEVVEPLADATDGDIYVRTTDFYRGFPYQWPGDTPEEKLSGYMDVMERQLDQIQELDPEYRDNIVIEPFNEPEGNMFGTGEWSYDGTSWLDDPTDYFRAWDDAYALIREKLPDVRISGPNTSILYEQVYGFMEHAVEAGTVPDIITWHELSHPEQVRDSVETYRQWEREIFAGTGYEGTELPINVNEYAFNYHTSVPGQMIQWISAIEESKIDAMIAFWNINGNISDSAVEANRGNGQWWLYNAYGSMTGHTVEVSPPFPGENYTLQGVATLDEDMARSTAIVGGTDGPAFVEFDNVPEDVFGDRVRAWIREIPWTGQIGDSAAPELITEEVVDVEDGTVAFDFGGALPQLQESSAYEIVLTPAGNAEPSAEAPTRWKGSFEAEDAEYTGSGYSVNGPEGSPDDVSKYYTSGGYNVGGLRTGSDGVLDFTVEAPEDGTYDLRVFANSLNTYDLVQEQGPTNVFLRVNGEAEQEMFLPLGYNWVVWDYTETTVELAEGENTISLAAESLDGSGATRGNAIIDRITLALPNPGADVAVHEAELADLDGAQPVYDTSRWRGSEISGSGAVQMSRGESATFWVYSAADAESTIRVRTAGGGNGTLTVNGENVMRVNSGSAEAAVSLSGGINQVTVTGASRRLLLDRIDVEETSGTLATTTYDASDAETAGSAEVTTLSLARDETAVTGIGGEPGNSNTATFEVEAERDGIHAMRVRYSNPEQSEASHYNPNPMARRADISVNGSEATEMLVPGTFHENNFWERTIPLELEEGTNTITFSSEEKPNFDGESYSSDLWPGILLRSQYAPVIDEITIAEFARPLPGPG